MGKLRVVGPDESAIFMPTEIVMRLVEELLPYALNSRTHTPASTATLAGMIQKFGWTNPVLVADGGILAGHGRIMAAKKLGLVKVPCIDLSHLDGDARRALVIADNRSSELSGWSLEELKGETDYLRDVGFDMEADLGFAEEDLTAMFEGLGGPPEAGDGDPDEVPEVPAEPVSRVGDVWVCGAHRVMCGSALDLSHWDALMGGELADVVWTDPPYNVDIGGKNESLDRADGGNRAKTGKLQNDKLAAAEFREFLLGMYRAVFEVMKPGAPIYVAHADKEALAFRAAFEEAEFKFSSMVIWKKNVMVLGMSDFQPIHEPIIYGWKPGSKHRWYGGRKNTSVIDFGENGPFTQLEDGRWQIKIGDSIMVVSGDATVQESPASVIHEAKPAKSGLHPTQKPVALVERLLKQSARAGDIVVDAFGGSGTTLVAADRMGMCARLMELDPAFADVIVVRWQQLTGRRAELASTGELFPAGDEVREPAPDELPPAEGIF